MQLEVRQSEDTFVIIGECGRCQRGSNSIIMTKVIPLNTSIANVELKCICCGINYKTRLRFNTQYRPSEDTNDG